MSTTYTLETLRVARHVLTGASAPQGADGTAQLAADALADMASSSWARDDSAPTMPVHDFKRPRPTGDAYKATWGYDPDARTQRSCCGAVCYVVEAPSAPAGAAPSAIVATVRGDRYLDLGADVAVAASATADPLPWASLGSLAWTTVCATSPQAPTPPNRRAGVEAAATFAAPGAARYWHVYIVLRDYLGVRDAWIEGGAMLAGLEVEYEGDYSSAPEVHEPMYSFPQYAATTSSLSNDSPLRYTRYSTCGAVLAVLEFPTRWWWSSVAGSATEPGAGWGTTARAMRELVEDIRAPLQSYHNSTTAVVTPGMHANVWGGSLQTSASGWPVTGVVQDARGRNLYGLHVGYQAMRVDGDATSQQKVIGLGCVVGVPVRRAGTFAPATGLRNWHDIAMGLHVSVEVAVYIAPRPPAYFVGEDFAITGEDGVSTMYPTVTCATPSPYAIRPADIWAGTATSINMYDYRNLDGADGPGRPYAPLAMRFLMRFELDGNVPSGRVFPFPRPVADDDATILIFVRPTTFLRSGTPPDSTQDCFVSWPFDGWQLTLG